MGYRGLIAWRYLIARRRISLVNVLSVMSGIGISVGVAALIVVLSVMNGFYDVVRDLLISVDPHVRITSAQGAHIEGDVPLLVDIIASLPNVARIEPYVEGKALLQHDARPQANRVVVVRGVDSLRGLMKEVAGVATLDNPGGSPGVMIGRALAYAVAADPGTEIDLLSASALGQALTSLFPVLPQQRFEVLGNFSLQSAYDESHVFVDLEEAQRLFRMPGKHTGVAIWLTDFELAASVKEALKQDLSGSDVHIETWYDQQRSLYDVMRMEKWGASLVLILISIVAAFNIVGSMTMLVIEKRRDIGVLQTMGVSKKGIRRIFLFKGALIGVAGVGLGFLIGLSVCVLQQQFQLVPLLGAESFIISAYPVSIRVLDLVVIGGASFLLCLLSATYPAVRAARIAPATAVRHTD